VVAASEAPTCPAVAFSLVNGCFHNRTTGRLGDVSDFSHTRHHAPTQ
ncbi:uncharacterized protein METZ01_LOCUS142429, partial [marine metagenome]